MTDHHATSAHSTALSAARRDRELAALRERTDPVDLVVIGLYLVAMPALGLLLISLGLLPG